MQLRAILQAIPAIRSEGNLDREITGLAYDSRRVTPGMMFFALRGQQADGHAFIPNAVDRGAAAIVCEENGFGSQRAAKIKVRDTREFLAQTSALFYERPSERLRMVGITGTNGKTTVAFMVKHLLESAGLKTGLIGTVRYEIGDRVIPAQRTTPEALEVQQMLAQMLRAGCGACVMEVSSHALHQRRVEQVRFDTVVFTNLTQDHLDYHGTMERYFEAKQRLFSQVEAQDLRGGAVVNAEDLYGQRLAARYGGLSTLTFGTGSSVSVRLVHVELDRDGTRMICDTPLGRLEGRFPLLGRHNAFNAMAAIGVAIHQGMRLEAIQEALRRLPIVPGRLERIDSGQPFGVIVDYAHTDDALRHLLTTLREVTSGRLLLAFGCGGSRDTGKRQKMGQVAASLADFTFITTDNPRRESPFAIACQIEDGFRMTGSTAYRIELDRRRAIEELLRMARPGDTAVLAGKGHETYQEFEDTVVPFDDRLHAREVLDLLGFSGGRSHG